MSTKEIKWNSFQKLNEASAKSAPTSPGIYLLWVELKNGKWRCFYVGQAGNLRKRLLEHLSDEEENECIKNNVSKYSCGFEYAVVQSESDRDGIEKYLYDHFKPECNKISPPKVTPIQVNIP